MHLTKTDCDVLLYSLNKTADAAFSQGYYQSVKVFHDVAYKIQTHKTFLIQKKTLPKSKRRKTKAIKGCHSWQREPFNPLNGGFCLD